MYWLSPQVTSFLRKRHFFTVRFIPRALWTVSAQVEIWLSRETNDGFLVWAHCFFWNEPKVLSKIADTVSIRCILSGPHIGWARKFAGVSHTRCYRKTRMRFLANPVLRHMPGTIFSSPVKKLESWTAVTATTENNSKNTSGRGPQNWN